MSLLQRVERAQQAIKASEATAAPSNGAAAPEIEAVGASATELGFVAMPSALALGVEPPAPLDPTPLAPYVPIGLMQPLKPMREDLLREVRLRLQAEVVVAFHELLDAKDTEVRGKIEALVDRVIGLHGFALTGDERLRLVSEMVHDVTGFGPLEPLLADPTITEVMVNGPTHIYVERHGKIQRVDTVFLNDEHVLRIIDRIITPLGRRIDESSPRVDARLPDGSRVNAVIEPLSLIGPVITIKSSPPRRSPWRTSSDSEPPRTTCSRSSRRASRPNSMCSSRVAPGPARRPR